jgi:hypothetical protein
VTSEGRAAHCPDTLFKPDAVYFLPIMNAVRNTLLLRGGVGNNNNSNAALAAAAARTTATAPVITRVWNDGEQYTAKNGRVAYELDPVMVEDYERSGIATARGDASRGDHCWPGGNVSNCRDWFSYASAWHAGVSNR